MFPIALRRRWRDLLSGFWFIPGLVFLLGPALAFLCLAIDHHTVYPGSFSFVFDNPDAVRSVLTTVSGVLISIAALIFSITLVALQLISSQFTPRAIRGLLSDRINQVTTGALVGIFAYCQVILFDVRSATPAHSAFLPFLGVCIATVENALCILRKQCILRKKVLSDRQRKAVMDQQPHPTESTQVEQRSARQHTNEHLANDRTGLAWIRTGLAIIGIGFVISRFGLLLRAQPRPDLPSSTLYYSSLLGLFLVALGVFTLVFALISYVRIHLAIEREQFPGTPWFLVALMGLLALLGIFLFLYMWLVS